MHQAAPTLVGQSLTSSPVQIPLQLLLLLDLDEAGLVLHPLLLLGELSVEIEENATFWRLFAILFA